MDAAALHGISEADRAMLEEAKAGIRTVDPQAETILFGSRARGDAEPDSDWDLLILLERERSVALRSEIRAALLPVEMRHDAMIGIICRNKAEWESSLSRATPLYREIARDGIAI